MGSETFLRIQCIQYMLFSTFIKNLNKDEIETFKNYQYKNLLEAIPDDALSITFSVGGAVENIFVGLAKSPKRYDDVWEIALSESNKKYKRYLYAIRNSNQGSNLVSQWHR